MLLTIFCSGDVYTLVLLFVIFCIYLIFDEAIKTYNKIIRSYKDIENLWTEIKNKYNNNDNKSTIDEIFKLNGKTLHLFLWSSSFITLLISFIRNEFVVFYILLIPLILLIHWTVAVLFNPIQKIEEIKIIGETDNEYKIIKNAYLIEETDREYIIICKNNDILRIPKDSCILKNVRTPLDEIESNGVSRDSEDSAQ
ncbi:hypothetical protein JH146_0869 [Methanocaldococcus bathoardescens]|uniref:Uncharacterized protein n=1 Tax=Methanocaldococcus bathoardescens TaxID=1301915 RepID=A0A076LJH5_9EURY|nr:hypothetical protein [Methanocaldococcus bathoardescens]AIJ05714.1 hypothetical protein JH146_0869 [Methanocaldococcus bathoardescens]